MKTIITLVAILGLATFTYCNNWAVLVAGSNQYKNYRHQADTCHAYHILINGGFKPENIIHFAYNDIAYNYQNPFQGKLFNKPDPEGEGQDVYEGCQIDYQGQDVTPSNFLKVLKGEQTTRLTKVLKSTSDDNVFIYFADHGGPNILCFPFEYLYKKDLWPALKYMQDNNMYKKLTFYIEACESGSICKDDALTAGSNIYCVTAANPTQPSAAAYCGTKVNYEYMPCLGDQFSVSWMEDTDDHPRSTTLEEQYQRVKDKVSYSQCSQWLNQGFVNDQLGDFVGFTTSTVQYFNEPTDYTLQDDRLTGLHFLKQQAELHPDSREHQLAFAKELREHNFINKVFKDLAKLHGVYEDSYINYEKNGIPEFDQDCYQELIEAFESKCQKIPEHGLPNLKVLAHICKKQVNKTLFNQLVPRICKLE